MNVPESTVEPCGAPEFQVNSADLTIVVMTRDRVDLLEKALVSVREESLKAPPVVIVSNNSTREHPEIAELQRRYRVSHVRQSGTLTVTEHHNACLRLATTKWVWLLHDDDTTHGPVLYRRLVIQDDQYRDLVDDVIRRGEHQDSYDDFPEPTRVSILSL